ncbi:phosphatidylserine/phosphatidylglycerophosphate/cardiolipin synthase-like enzyme [Blastococcus colisei]|uniref:Phosphatidylserine/phosphatidylglycerophosphate/ cardiolipin synthase-like enzyme n=1 Tax=Blastococcus colisei TaxID=1564162 RepID=A0A543PAP9_9ACTN|nr:phospholipase D-like domain-containing protein [Blastococcus colisei]TQN41161.1 phosphatidylserine/phosphatidylglycerophosphate/cardiolipin synthase-like enzyme [Blastococcus colisei]
MTDTGGATADHGGRTISGLEDDAILVPGETCWRIERADRHTVFIDAADYFAALKQAVPRAERRVLFIGWDFEPRIRLDPRAPGPARDDRLGRVLEAAVRGNPELEIGVLQWGLGMLESLRRGVLPAALLDRKAPERLRFTVDHRHPLGASHHQKIVVIDDCLAFAGGIDVTSDRWDTSEHLDRHRHRHRPTSRRPTGPWHDVTSLVSGPAARALGDLARERWESGTGRHLEPIDDVEACWPEGVEPLLTDVDVAISRTRPAHGGRELVHEIELLWLAAIAAARETVYIESQYFANRRIAEAIAERLGEEDGPEFVLVNPESADGWLEEKAMGTARARLLDIVRQADVHDRFRIHVPVTEGGRPVYVHAKVMVVDDRLLRIGSSNLNNRSMGLDTECDVTIEARSDDPRHGELAATVLGMRHRLLGEHLGVEPDAVASAVEAHDGSLVRAVDSLRTPAGRSLRPLEPPEQHVVDRVLAHTELLDPERTPDRWSRVRRAFPRRRGRPGH